MIKEGVPYGGRVMMGREEMKKLASGHVRQYEVGIDEEQFARNILETRKELAKLKASPSPYNPNMSVEEEERSHRAHEGITIPKSVLDEAAPPPNRHKAGFGPYDLSKLKASPSPYNPNMSVEEEERSHRAHADACEAAAMAALKEIGGLDKNETITYQEKKMSRLLEKIETMKRQIKALEEIACVSAEEAEAHEWPTVQGLNRVIAGLHEDQGKLLRKYENLVERTWDFASDKDWVRKNEDLVQAQHEARQAQDVIDARNLARLWRLECTAMRDMYCAKDEEFRAWLADDPITQDMSKVDAEQIECLEAQLRERDLYIKDCQSEIKTKNEEIKRLCDYSFRVSSDVSESRFMAGKWHRECNKMREALEKCRAERSEQMKSLASRCAEDSLDKLRGRKRLPHEERQWYKNQFKEAQEDISRHKKSLEYEKKMADLWKNQYHGRLEEFAELEANYDALEANLRARDSKIEDFKEKLREKNEQVELWKKESHKHAEQFRFLQGKLREKDEEIKNLKMGSSVDWSMHTCGGRE